MRVPALTLILNANIESLTERIVLLVHGAAMFGTICAQRVAGAQLPRGAVVAAATAV